MSPLEKVSLDICQSELDDQPFSTDSSEAFDDDDNDECD